MFYVGVDGFIGSVGILGNEVVGCILVGGVCDMVDWVNKLYGQVFVVVYVQFGVKVVVYFEKLFVIDFDFEGCKVDYCVGESYVFEFE